MKDEKQVTHSAEEVYCNCCGTKIEEISGKLMDYLRIDKEWNYFSSKDLTKHSFNICERCYDKWVAMFKIPVEEYPVEDIYVYTDEEMEVLSKAYIRAELCK